MLNPKHYTLNPKPCGAQGPASPKKGTAAKAKGDAPPAAAAEEEMVDPAEVERQAAEARRQKEE